MSTADMLRARDIQPSWQRIRIYETLAATTTHPCADTIHAALVPQIPTLSRTTVYATLDLLSRAGLVRTLTISATELRFDADTSQHAHCLCRRCGRVEDLPGIELPAVPSLPDGWTGGTLQLYLEGVCPDCAAESS
jgi:Fe2+ or Zn2+ uptake regulation protein